MRTFLLIVMLPTILGLATLSIAPIIGVFALLIAIGGLIYWLPLKARDFSPKTKRLLIKVIFLPSSWRVGLMLLGIYTIFRTFNSTGIMARVWGGFVLLCSLGSIILRAKKEMEDSLQHNH